MILVIAQGAIIEKTPCWAHGSRCLGLGEPAAALGPCDAGHRLDRHLLPFHLARRQPAPRGRSSRGRLRRQLDGPWRRLITRASSWWRRHPARRSCTGSNTRPISPGSAASCSGRGLLPRGQRIPDRSRGPGALPAAAIAISMGSLAAGWICYDALCRSPIGQRPGRWRWPSSSSPWARPMPSPRSSAGAPPSSMSARCWAPS